MYLTFPTLQGQSCRCFLSFKVSACFRIQAVSVAKAAAERPRVQKAGVSALLSNVELDLSAQGQNEKLTGWKTWKARGRSLLCTPRGS